MENRNISNSQSRGAQTKHTFMVMGDRNALLLPLFLHAYHGKLKGILLCPGEPPAEFGMSLGEFRKTDMRLVKE